jgi:hypothetical protein
MSLEQYPVRADLAVEEDEITGYVEPWILSPGDTADVKVHIVHKLVPPALKLTKFRH